MRNGPPYKYGYHAPENYALQKALTDHGYDTKGQDGDFGNDTRDAVEAAQQFFNVSPADGVPRGDLLSFLGLTPPPAPKASNPITDYLTGLAIQAALNSLKGLLPMNFLTGYATNIGGVISILIGIAGLAGIHPAGASSLDFNASIQLIAVGWAALGLRRAVANLSK